MRYRAVITDNDGVVYDSVKDFPIRMERIFAAEGFRPRRDLDPLLLNNSGMVIINILEHTYGLHRDDAIRFYRRIEQLELEEPPRLIEGVDETLWLLNHQCYLIQFTARPVNNLMQLLKHDQIDGLFDFFSTRDTRKYQKPLPRALDEIMDFLASENVTPDQCLYFGDTLYDVRCGLDRGITVLPVLSGGGTLEQFLEAGVQRKNILNYLPDIFEWMHKNGHEF